MFDDDEDELELLRQYEGDEGNESEDKGHSSDEIDSDLEDKIMSMVQYGSGLTKKKVPATVTTPSVTEPSSPITPAEEPEVVHAPVDSSKSKKSDFSFSNELQLNNSDLEEEDGAIVIEDSDKEQSEEEAEDMNVDNEPNTIETNNENDATKVDIAAPQVTNFIDLNDQQPMYMEDVETSDEEAELNDKLQELIEDQIYNRQAQNRKRFGAQTVRVCFSCHQPGHERKDCTLCFDCGGPKHSEPRCVGTRYCSRCKQRGHMKIDCDERPNYNNCRLCNMNFHDWTCCPSLVHVYKNEKVPVETPTAFCYNCTEKGHYGDECPYRPLYLSELPSAFSQLSFGLGSRFDPKKTLKESAASFSRKQNSHQRWSDSSRESSPRRGGGGYSNKKRSNDSDSGSPSRHSSKRSKNSHNNDRGYKYKYTTSSLEQVFGNTQRSGSINWNNVKKTAVPKPTRSGTVNVSKNNNNSSGSRQNRGGYEADFPRSTVPRPSSSGIIDLTGDSSSSNSNKRAPKYHGGYKRSR